MRAQEAPSGLQNEDATVMAEFKFSCPSCKQNIICDELWCGQAIQCPSCSADIVVPAQQAAPSSSLVPKAPPAGAAPKLSLGRQQGQASPTSVPATQRFIPGTQPLPPPPKRKSKLVPQLLMTVAVLGVLGVGGYFGYGWWNDRREKANAAAAAAANPAPATPAEPAAPKPLPILPAVWTLDVAAANIPEGQANGALGGTNFLVESAIVNKVGTAQVLDLRQGAGASPDREVMIYLHLGAGETLAGHSWTVSQEMKGAAVPQVLKRWKAGAASAPQQKFFSTGYAMKLELGQATDGTIPGKIFLALPDPEQSVVAGIFKIAPPSTDPNAQPVVNQAPAPGVPNAGAKAAFDRRYGVRKP